MGGTDAKKLVKKAFINSTKCNDGIHIEDLHEWLVAEGTNNKKACVPLSDIQKVAQILEWDGLVEVEKGLVRTRRWYPTQTVMEAFVEIPCGTCPVSNECSTHGKINPNDCKFFQNWLSC